MTIKGADQRPITIFEVGVSHTAIVEGATHNILLSVYEIIPKVYENFLKKVHAHQSWYVTLS